MCHCKSGPSPCIKSDGTIGGVKWGVGVWTAEVWGVEKCRQLPLVLIRPLWNQAREAASFMSDRRSYTL